MSVEVTHGRWTYRAGEDLTTKKFHAAMLDTTAAKTVILCTDPKRFIGVIDSPGVQDRAGAAPAVEVRTMQENVVVGTTGRMKCVAQAAITVGAKITVHTDGRFRVATTGETFVGIAEEAASGAGIYFTMLRVGNGGVV